MKEAVEKMAVMKCGGLKITCSFLAAIIHGTTNCERYKSSKVAYV